MLVDPGVYMENHTTWQLEPLKKYHEPLPNKVQSFKGPEAQEHTDLPRLEYSVSDKLRVQICRNFFLLLSSWIYYM